MALADIVMVVRKGLCLLVRDACKYFKPLCQSGMYVCECSCMCGENNVWVFSVIFVYLCIHTGMLWTLDVTFSGTEKNNVGVVLVTAVDYGSQLSYYQYHMSVMGMCSWWLSRCLVIWLGWTCCLIYFLYLHRNNL